MDVTNVWEDETYLDYKVTQEDSVATFIFAMTPLFFANVSIFSNNVIENPTCTKNPIITEPVNVGEWLTPRWKAIMKPHLKKED